MKREKGQVLILGVAILPVLLVILGLVIDGAVLVRDRVRLQNAVDAGVLVGGAVLADGLHAICILNIGIGAATVSIKGIPKVPMLRDLQEAIALATPAAAVGAGIATALTMGAAQAYPANILSGSLLPQMDVYRPWVYMRDNLQGGRPFGGRYIRLVAISGQRESLFIGRLLPGLVRQGRAVAVAEAGVGGGRVSAFPRMAFHPYLVPVLPSSEAISSWIQGL